MGGSFGYFMTEEKKEIPASASVPEDLIEKTSIVEISRTLLEDASLAGRRRASLSGEDELSERPLIFDNHWQIVERLGEGGMSVVYKARHLELNRLVAIKVLLPHLTCNMKNLQRFRQEAVTASQLNHPNVIKVENFGVTPDGRTFIVMDFIEGVSLSDLIAKEGKIDPMRALFIFVQCTNALQHAHDRNVIHRDLKPSNIMLVDDEESGEVVRIVDFGIAKLVLDDEDQVQHLTQTGEVFGSPLYMSPEQCRGEKLDNRSDIYSMGVLMYETLAGRAPLKGANALDTMQRQLSDAPEPIVSETAPDSLLKRLNTIVLKALEKDPALRYQSMQEMESDLNNALISAEKDWRNRAKRLKKTYKRLKPQKWTSRRMAAVYGIGLAVVFVGYFGAKVAMFDPLTAMELEPESLFSQVEKPAAKQSDEQFALKTEQMDVIVMRDTPIWKQIQARIRSGDRRVEDLDRVASELIPNALLAAKKYRESGNFHAAINFENWVLDMYSVLAQPDAAEYVATYMLQGKDYLSLNQYGKAYRAFRNAYDRASKTLNSDARRDTIMQLNFALMRLAVHERNFEEALRHAGEISEGFFERAKWRDYHPNYQDIFAFQSELADIERLNNMPGSVGDFKRAIKNWENFIKSSRSNDQYDWQEYLAKSRYGLGLAEAQQKDFQSARENLETAYEFFRLRGKDPALTERVRKNYLLILRKTNPFEYLLKSLRS